MELNLKKIFKFVKNTFILIFFLIIIIMFIYFIINSIYNQFNKFQKTIKVKSKDSNYRKNKSYYIVDSNDITYSLDIFWYKEEEVYDSINIGDVIEIKGSYNLFLSIENINEIIKQNSIKNNN